jgi:hypothetical protein
LNNEELQISCSSASTVKVIEIVKVKLVGSATIERAGCGYEDKINMDTR